MSHNLLPHIAERVFNTPLLIHPGKLDAMLYGLRGRLGVPVDPPAPGLFTTETGEPKYPGYRVLDGGIAVLDIFGVLAHRGGLAADSSFVLGYQDIARRIGAALADNDVRAILLNIESPGGEVSGAFDLADRIRALRDGAKPIHAVAADYAFSAAYLIGSAARSLHVSQAGMAGSIGVVMRHVDFSAALDQEGIKVTHIFAGAHKVDGNPYEALPDDVRARFQARIDNVYRMFVDAVAVSRGIEADAVRATEADVFDAEPAMELGLADSIAAPDQIIERLRSETTGASRRYQQEGRMSVEEKTTGPNEPANPTAKASGPEPGPAAPSAAAPTPNPAPEPGTVRAEDHVAAVAQARTDERERIQLILTCEEAQGRGEFAQHLAFESDLSADQAVAMLAKAPKAAQGADGGFLAAMAQIDNPEVDAGGAGDDDSPDAVAARIAGYAHA